MQNISSLEHEDFVRAAETGSAEIVVRTRLARRVMCTSLVPAAYKFAFRLWGWIWLSLLPAGLMAGHVYGWWWSVACGVVLLALSGQSRNRSAAAFVVEYAKESELFYDIMVQTGVMRVKPAGAN